MDRTATAGSINRVGFFGVVAWGQSYLNSFYFLLSFPLGLSYFVFLLAGFALGFTLAIVGIGLFILALMLGALRALAGLECRLGTWLLGAQLPPPPPVPGLWKHPLNALKKHMLDSYTWRILAYFIAKPPFSIFTFTLLTISGGVTLSLVAAPALYQFTPLTIGTWRVATAQEALFCMAVGLILGVISLHILNLLASGWRAFSTWTLAGLPARGGESGGGPVIIP